jgi:hypothetical protein
MRDNAASAGAALFFAVHNNVRCSAGKNIEVALPRVGELVLKYMG